MKFLNLILATATIASASLAASAATPKVVSHRGYWKAEGSAQNTRTSFIKADSIGVFGSEIDVWLTADDHLIVNHDRKFQGVEMEFDPFETIRSLKLNNGEQIPTLDEYLSVVRKHPKTRLVLEMKSLTDFGREDKAVQMIADKLRQYNLVDKTDIIVFSINAALQFKKIFPAGVKIFYLDGDMAPKKVKKLGLAGIDYSVKVLREHPEWIKEAQKLGLEVNVWTVNTPEDIEYFVEQGVDYITTDNPEDVQKYIKNYKPAKDSKKKKK